MISFIGCVYFSRGSWPPPLPFHRTSSGLKRLEKGSTLYPFPPFRSYVAFSSRIYRHLGNPLFISSEMHTKKYLPH